MDFTDYHIILSMKGIITGVFQPNSTTSVDYMVDVGCMITGCDYEAVGRNVGDQVTFQIVHPATQQVLNEFATDLYVRDSMIYQFYKASLFPGLIIRLIYKNTGSNVVNFNLNLIQHIPK